MTCLWGTRLLPAVVWFGKLNCLRMGDILMAYWTGIYGWGRGAGGVGIR